MQLDRYLLLHPDAIRYMKNRWEQRRGRGCVLSSWQLLTALGAFYRFLRSKTLDTAHWRIYRPTTGALLLLTALQLCDQVKLCRRSPGDLGKPLCVFLQRGAAAGLAAHPMGGVGVAVGASRGPHPDLKGRNPERAPTPNRHN